MLRMKLHVRPVRRHRRPNISNQARFDVSKLKEHVVGSHGRVTARGHFQEMVGEKLTQHWKETDPIEKKWTSVKSALCEAAEVTMGREKRRQADWFRENTNVICPLLQKETPCTISGSVSGGLLTEEFKKARTEAQKAIREAKTTGSRSKPRKHREEYVAGRWCGSA